LTVSVEPEASTSKLEASHGSIPPLAFWRARPIAMYGIVDRTEPVSTHSA